MLLYNVLWQLSFEQIVLFFLEIIFYLVQESLLFFFLWVVSVFNIVYAHSCRLSHNG